MKKTIKVCPNRGSTNIGPGMGGDILGTNCFDWGYRDSTKEKVIDDKSIFPGYKIFLEIKEDNLKDFQKSLKKKINK